MARPSHSVVTVYEFNPKEQFLTGKRKPHVIECDVSSNRSYYSFQYMAKWQFHAHLFAVTSNGERLDSVTNLSDYENQGPCEVRTN